MTASTGTVPKYSLSYEYCWSGRLSGGHALYDRASTCTGTRGSHLQHDPPAAPAVRESWIAFCSAKRSDDPNARASCSRYLVEREQAGEAERLKGYAIAVDVFGKDAEFDSVDRCGGARAGGPAARAARPLLRDGRPADPIRMVIPRGSYVPAYEEMPADWPTQDCADAGDQPAARDASRATHAGRPARTSRRCRSLASAWARSGCCGVRWLSSRCCSSLSPIAPACTEPRRRRPIPPSRRKRRCRPRPSPIDRRSEALPTIRVRRRKTTIRRRSASLPSSRRPSPASTRWT